MEGGDAKYKCAKTSVWWDMESCGLPEDGSYDPNTIAHNITSALVDKKYVGSITIFAYGDIEERISKSVQEALFSSGITLNHTPSSPSSSSSSSSSGVSFTKILVDMLVWAVDNPAPANYLLISGDCNFSHALHQLCMRRYNILIAQPQNASGSLAAAAKSVWLWNCILAGPSLSNGELFQFYNKKPSCNRTENSVSECIQLSQSVASDSESGYHKLFCNGNGDANASKGKQIWRNSSEPHMMRTSSVEISIQGHNNGSTRQPSSPEMSIAPHEFFNAVKRDTSSSGSSRSPVPSNPDLSLGNGYGLVGVHQHQFTEINHPDQPNFAPDKFFHLRSTQNNLPVQSNFAPDSFFQKDSPTDGPHPALLMPNVPTVTSSTHSNMNSFENQETICNPIIQQKNGESKKSIFESLESFKFVPDSFSVHNIPSSSCASQKNQFHPPGTEFPHELSLTSSTDPVYSNGVWGTPGCPEPSVYVQGLIGIVLLALHTLKCEKMIPTEANITDCIHYGDSRHQITDVRSALNHALEQQMIVRQTVGMVHIYVGKNARIWKCVDPMGGNPKQYSKETWNEIHKYLSSPVGQFKMMASGCRYEAATFLRNLCLKYLALGDVLQILNMIINNKNWIIVHPSGWQPISITLADNTASI